ncbi:MAG TPA: transcriptional regulator [Treponema sp.]|nr:transcriptional regulator [Treponema sp.]
MNIIQHQAKEDFSRARNRAFIKEIQNFLTPDRRKLLSFHDVKKILKPNNEVYIGMKAVSIDKIAGSEGRYRDFDSHFLPKSSFLRHRWERVDEAHLTDVSLPPIQLYEIGGLYFVRDGNHRVSVAKAQGVEFIDAEIISLKSEIKLTSKVTPETLLDEVIKYEKRIFYTNTSFGDLTDEWNLDFTAAGQYDVIYNHILVHKYYINETVKTEIPFPEAMLSWYKNVYQPVIRIIEKKKLLKKFRGRTSSDLYVWVIKQWDELKKTCGDSFPLDEATNRIEEKCQKSFFRNFLRRRKNSFET